MSYGSTVEQYDIQIINDGVSVEQFVGAVANGERLGRALFDNPHRRCTRPTNMDEVTDFMKNYLSMVPVVVDDRVVLIEYISPYTFVNRNHDDEFFGDLAPFMDDGSYADYYGEDNAIWRFRVRDGVARRIKARVVFDAEGEAI